ncbi:hypothetical protein [Algoriphagus sediminis]|uniref:DUF4185 domain-containing protein n=1 Tax=Algoriphagus sediminis TaxID=3057113 RepID=A0ABT7YC55_9BACT|nr:hypothetical protein [Algoriphagus sediminis]MDN3204108.1 hypothetical protein [Algoriphagus sediminis]
MKNSILRILGLALILSLNQFCSAPTEDREGDEMVLATETSPLMAQVQGLFEGANEDSTVSDFIQIHLEAEDLGFLIPALQSPVYATYGSQWVMFGGRKAGLHNMNNDPPAFPNLMANDSIWVVDLDAKKTTGVPVPPLYTTYLSGSSMLHYQEGETLYASGGYTSIGDTTISNWTSDHFFEINIPGLIQYVNSGGSTPALDQVFTKVISDPFLQVTGGEMMVSNGNFYLIGGQNYKGAYLPGNTGDYTRAVRKFSLTTDGINWMITDTLSVIDSTKLHRRDYTLAEVITPGPDSLGAVIYGGVFNQYGLGYPSPVYLNDLGSGVPSVTLDEETLQKVNLYSAAQIDAVLAFGEYRVSRISILGGITDLSYFPDSSGLGESDIPLPFSNLISTYYTNGEDETIELVQTPPNALMPGYLGSNAVFFPLPGLLYGESESIIDLNKVFPGDASGPVLVGYMYGGIESPVANPMNGMQNYNTKTNSTLYGVYMTLGLE